MVTTPTVPTTAIAATGTSALSKLSGNFNDFLKLLMTQLQNQDPTAPMDTNQFTTQLVQFSSVEQQIDTNASLNKLISLQQGGEVLQSAALVGKTVQVTGRPRGAASGRQRRPVHDERGAACDDRALDGCGECGPADDDLEHRRGEPVALGRHGQQRQDGAGRVLIASP